MPDLVNRLDTIEKLAFRSAELIKNMLSFARKGTIEKTSFDLIPFLNETCKMHRLSLPENISLKFDIEITPNYGDIYVTVILLAMIFPLTSTLMKSDFKIKEETIKH